MNARDYIQHMSNMIRAEWFKTHVAKFKGGEPGYDHTQLLWSREDGRFVYQVFYNIKGRHLIVLGDLGTAVYSWSERLTWKFLKGCDLHYFVEKCEASEVGKSFRQWNSEVAKGWVADWNKEHPNDYLIDTIAADDGEASSPQEFAEFLRDNQKVFGPQWYEFSGVGYVIHPRAIAHWLGIRMAIK